MKASKSKLADNDMWDPLVIGSNISLLHGHKKGRLELAITIARAAPAHRGEATLTRRDGGEAQRWRSEVEGGSAVVKISTGGRWTKLHLFGVRR